MNTIIDKILLEASNVLDKHIINPDTGNKIKVSSALSYAETTPVYKTAKAMVDKADAIVSKKAGKKVAKKNPKAVKTPAVVKAPKSSKAVDPKDPNSRSHKPKSASYGISKECVAYLKDKGFTGLNALPQSFVKPEEIKFNPALKTKDKDSVWVAQFPFMLKNGQVGTKTVYTKGFMKKSQVKKYKKISKISTKDIASLDEKTQKLLKAKDTNTADSAAVIGIILKTGLRIGSADHADTGNLGVRTLNKENVIINGNKVNLKFIGKSYQENIAEFEDPAIAAYLSSKLANKKDGERVFDCSYGQVSTVMDNINPKGIHPKDLRTYKATSYAKSLLDDKSIAPPPLPTDQKQIKNLVKDKLAMVFDKVSKLLNNSPTMARNSYVHPVVITDFLNNLGLTPKFVGYKHITLPESKQLKESILTPEEKKLVDELLNRTKSFGVNRKNAILQLVDIASQKSGKPINSYREALLALDYVEPKAYNDGRPTKLEELDIADVQEDLNSSMDDFYSKYEDEYTNTSMDEMFAQNMDYGADVVVDDISDEDSDDCEEYEVPEWYYSDEWDLVLEQDEEIISTEINKII